ncbi:hypothetical protein [Halomonas sp. DQ26W]|uniref:hypothetical protein n=1 Tax=Halomonas sp. DQ26W TaxID=2282311 RepID=UPI0015F02688|nr:hypothetical protein [Halomonas sp. DQ26W]
MKNARHSRTRSPPERGPGEAARQAGHGAARAHATHHGVEAPVHLAQDIRDGVQGGDPHHRRVADQVHGIRKVSGHSRA